MMTLNFINASATVCFGFAIVHTFAVGWIHPLANRFSVGTASHNLVALFGEVEVVFGVWAALWLCLVGLVGGVGAVSGYLATCNMTEPAFVFVVMTVCSTRPILRATEMGIERVSRWIPGAPPLVYYLVCMSVGPVLGSFITEPAAMTVTAMLLLKRFYGRGISRRLMYVTLGLLFVNVSIGGALTPYAAPPLVMVAGHWGWGFSTVMTLFGWKAIVAIIAATGLTGLVFRKELSKVPWESGVDPAPHPIPLWVIASHVIFLGVIVMTGHSLKLFSGVFLFFLGWVSVTRGYQADLRFRQGLLVAFFLGGVVILGAPQRWWIEWLIVHSNIPSLFVGAMGLSAVVDNAAVTSLAAQVPLADLGKVAVVSGALVGGGLSVIANAPNPIGFALLGRFFGKDGIRPLGLFLGALGPTVIAAACFWFL